MAANASFSFFFFFFFFPDKCGSLPIIAQSDKDGP